MKIGIVGFGYVGKAMYEFFKTHYETIWYDTNIDSGFTFDDINKCDLGVVCVPTPTSEKDGSCDTSIVEDVVSKLETDIILIKSTVKPGTTHRLIETYNKKIVFSPEYCGESSYWSPYSFHTDIKETPFFIFGGDRESASKMVSLFEPITGPTKIYRVTSAKEAELAKYAENTFYATKIAYCYELAEICEREGVDYNEVKSLWLLDPRINPMHTSVFEQNDRPFGGKCLPKDLKGLIRRCEEIGYEPKLLLEVLFTNNRLEEIRRYRRQHEKDFID